MNSAVSVNRLAWKLLERLLENPEFYHVKIDKPSSGATIVDCGLAARGGFQAGKIVTQICMGGCGKATITYREYGNLELPSIFIFTDHPIIATLGSQYAGWQIKEDDYFAIGSGPARALALKPRRIYQEIDYKDDFDKAIVVLETNKYPPAKLIERFSKDCSISPDNLAVILTPTSSVAGATQVSGRIVETGVHRLRQLGLNPNVISHAWGCAPIPPIHPDFTYAMARSNDAILYGGIAYYAIEYDNDEELEAIVDKAPSCASKDYGKPFLEVFKAAKMDFYGIDPNLFAPAILIINNIKTGKVFKAGKINGGILAKSMGFQ